MFMDISSEMIHGLLPVFLITVQGHEDGEALSARGHTSESGMMEVPSHHDYFDKAYVKEWAENAIKERPERRALFDEIVI